MSATEVFGLRAAAFPLLPKEQQLPRGRSVMRVTKAMDLTALATELAAAGVAVPRGLGLSGYAPDGSAAVYTYDADGAPVELPAAAAPVVAAHDATQTPAAVQAAADTLTLDDLRDQAGAIVTRMQQIEAAVSPTQAQVIQAVKDEATAIRRLVRALAVFVRRQAG